MVSSKTGILYHPIVKVKTTVVVVVGMIKRKKQQRKYPQDQIYTSFVLVTTTERASLVSDKSPVKTFPLDNACFPGIEKRRYWT